MSNALPEAKFEVWGGVATLLVTDSAGLRAARPAVGAVIAAFDAACSRFREDSEISALNRAAGNSFRASALLIDAVSEAVRAAHLTDGDVDPTVGNALIALGYDRSFERIAEPPNFKLASVPGWRAIEIDRHELTVRVPPGVKLDLGATAKAMAADRAAAAAAAAAGCGVLVGLSGDIAVAGEPPDGGWRIRVTDDHRAGLRAPGQWVTTRAGGLATSSTTVRRWNTGGTAVHHLIDPHTGRPAPEIWRTVSVSAASCLDANIASTATIVRGRPAIEWLESLRLPGRLVATDGSVRHVAGWPSAGEQIG